MNVIASVLLVLALPMTAFAVDTWEPYPMGPGAIEFYFTQSGIGIDDDAAGSKSLVLGPAWGIHDTAHLYLFTGISHPKMGPGGVDFLSLGIFKNLYGGFTAPLKLDIYFDISAFGPGLGMSGMMAGLELNYDADGIGLYGRPALNWFHDGEGEGDSALSLAAGAWYAVAGIAEFFVEAGFAEVDDELEHNTTAIGLNVPSTNEVELILELRSPEPAEGEDRSYDVTVGAVTVW